MYFLYTVLGMAIVIACYMLYRPLLRLIERIRSKRRKPVDIEQLRNEIKDLHSEIDDLRKELHLLSQVTSDTQKTNELLFPESFDKNKSDGATIFVKDGEEKIHETIDWRSR